MHNKMGDCSVRVWYSKCEGLFHALRDDRHGRLTTPVFSPDGNCVATGEMGPIVNHVSPSAVHLWDANKGILLRSFVGHEDFIMSAAFSPDSRRIVSGSNDQTVRVWNVADGSEVLRLSIDEWVLKVSFSADGKRIAARSISGRHHEWECESGQKLGVVPQVDDQRTDEHGLGSGALNTAFAYDASGARFQLVVTASETTIEDPSCGLPVAWFSCKWDGVAGSLQHHIWAGAEQTHLYLMTLERTSLTERNTYG
jgi:WD40 repeat protein